MLMQSPYSTVDTLFEHLTLVVGTAGLFSTELVKKLSCLERLSS
jgi:hypothetical protein